MISYLTMQKWIEDLVDALKAIHEDIDPILTGKYNGDITETLIEDTVNDRITPNVKIYGTNKYITIAINGVPLSTNDIVPCFNSPAGYASLCVYDISFSFKEPSIDKK